MFVVDSTDRERLPKVRSEFKRVLKDKGLQEIPCVFMLNKIDLEDRMPIAELVDKLEIQEIRKTRTVIL